MIAIQKPSRAGAVLTATAVVGLLSAAAFAQPAPSPAPPDAGPAAGGVVSPATTSLSGVLEGYNVNPDGIAESLMLRSGDKLTQVNFPPHAGSVIGQSATVGEQVQLTATPNLGMPDHPIYELVSLKPAKGQAIAVPSPDSWRVQHVDGVVKRLNYGRRGEINGAVLESGDFVHFGPDAATLANITVGQKLAVDGYARPMLQGHNVIEADSVNGVVVRAAPPAPGPRGPRGPGRADAAPPPRPPR